MIIFKSRIFTWIIIATLVVSTNFANPVSVVGVEESEPAFQIVTDETCPRLAGRKAYRSPPLSRREQSCPSPRTAGFASLAQCMGEEVTQCQLFAPPAPIGPPPPWDSRKRPGGPKAI